MSLRLLKWITILILPLIIGGFEFIRHEFLEHLPIMLGNIIITLITLFISYFFASWLFEKIQHSNDRLAEEQAKRAVYEERERMARDLHDHIAQILFFLNVSLKKGNLDEARSAVFEIDNHLRQAIFNLRSHPYEGVQFSVRIKKWLEEWSELSGVEVNQDINIPSDYFNKKEEIQLFAVIQEAFTNIRKHSGATKSAIQFLAKNNEWELIIADNGQGIDKDQLNANKYGLSIIRKRCDELGAVFQISNVKDGGTQLSIKKERGRVLL